MNGNLKKKFALAILVLGLFAVALPAFADTCDVTPGNVILNCGFEDRTYTSTVGGYTNPYVPSGWTPNAGFDSEQTYNDVRTDPYQGSYNLSIGNFDYQPVPTLSQTFSDSSGVTYFGSLYVEYPGCCSDPDAFFQVLIDGVPLVTLGGATSPDTYTLHTFSFVATGSDTLTLQGNTNPEEWYVDDITVAPTTVPEPASLLLLSTGLSALAGFVRRRKV